MLKVTPLFSGSSGNSTLISFNSEHILIDAGVSFTQLKNELLKHSLSFGDISGIFITHEHTDHVKALRVLSGKYDIPIYINSLSANAIYNSPSSLLNDLFVITEAGSITETENFTIKAFRTPHDSAGSVGYRIDCADGDSFAIATDMGYISKSIASYLFGANTVIIESNHDVHMLKNGPYPYILKQRILSQHGHLSNSDCADFLPHLARHGTKNIYLGHLSKHNNTPEIAYESAKLALEKENFNNISLKVICTE